MFLLESFKRRGRSITALDYYEATVTALPTVRDLFRQRMRWAGKAPHYRDKDIRRFGTLVLLSNLLSVACPPWLIGKWIYDTLLLRRRLRRNVRKDKNRQVLDFLWAKTLLLTVLYPWYAVISLVGGLLRTNKW